MLGGELHRIKHAQDFVEVAAGGHRVGEHELDAFVGTNNKYGTHGCIVGGSAAFGAAGFACRQHVVKLGDGKVGVADHRIVDGRTLGFLNVFGPARVVVYRINTQAN